MRSPASVVVADPYAGARSMLVMALRLHGYAAYGLEGDVTRVDAAALSTHLRSRNVSLVVWDISPATPERCGDFFTLKASGAFDGCALILTTTAAPTRDALGACVGVPLIQKPYKLDTLLKPIPAAEVDR